MGLDLQIQDGTVPNFVNNDRGNNCYQNCQGSFIKENQSCNATCPAGATISYAYSDILGNRGSTL